MVALSHTRLHANTQAMTHTYTINDTYTFMHKHSQPVGPLWLKDRNSE
jgi:putative flippase GtrA